MEPRTEIVNNISEDESVSSSVNDFRLGSFFRSGCGLSLNQIFIFNDLGTLKSFLWKS